jgi:hypothetical protein
MDEEERDYRQWRGAQEQAQEQRYQQWEQERALERDRGIHGCGELSPDHS